MLTPQNKTFKFNLNLKSLETIEQKMGKPDSFLVNYNLQNRSVFVIVCALFYLQK